LSSYLQLCLVAEVLQFGLLVDIQETTSGLGMSEKTEKPKLSDKELKLIYLGAVVGAIASWVGNLVANGAAPPRVVE